MPYKRLLTKGFQNYWRRSRGLTLAAFAVITDASGKVLLVKAPGSPLWHLPGGRVLKGETAPGALERCLMSQAGLLCLAPPSLFAVYAGSALAPADQVALFVVPSWTQSQAVYPPNAHNSGMEFHQPGRLPHALAPGVQTVINDAVSARQSAELW